MGVGDMVWHDVPRFVQLRSHQTSETSEDRKQADIDIVSRQLADHRIVHHPSTANNNILRDLSITTVIDTHQRAALVSNILPRKLTAKQSDTHSVKI